MYQRGGAQAYSGNTLEADGSLDKASTVLVKRKKKLEKLDSSHGIDLGAVDLDGLGKDIGNRVSVQMDTLKNQSGKMVTRLWGRTDSTKGL